MPKPKCEYCERAKAEAERDAYHEKTDLLCGHLEWIQEIADAIDKAIHPYQTRPPEREVMKAKAAELVKKAKEVKKKVKRF